MFEEGREGSEMRGREFLREGEGGVRSYLKDRWKGKDDALEGSRLKDDEV